MRHIGALSDERQARTFVDYLIARGISASTDPEGGAWMLWVRDEDRVAEAKNLLDAYQRNPHDRQYQDAVAKAQLVRREEAQRRELARRNWVDMRNYWGGGFARRAPVVTFLIALSLGVAVITMFGRINPDPRATLNQLTFANTAQVVFDPTKLDDGWDTFQDVKRGQLWRLITPVFLHFGPLHLLFNMYMLYALGNPIENRRGRVRFAALVLALAVVSNVAQAWMTDRAPDSIWGGSPLFGGMSGVVYGLLGYLWMKAAFDRRLGLYVHPYTLYCLLFWLVLCMSGTVGYIANTSHVAGLVTGMAIGYAPCVWAHRA